MAYIDCDSHILPDDAFDEVDPEFRAQGPRIVSDDKGVRVVYPARQSSIPMMHAISLILSFCGRGCSDRSIRSRRRVAAHGEYVEVRRAGIGAQ